MLARPAHLADFISPPVSEVYFALYFARMPFHQAQVGAFWSELRDELPNLEDREPTPPPPNLLAENEGPAFSFELASVPPLRRSWFISEDGEDLVQLQSDRLVQNWRRGHPESVYPRYEPLRAKFVGRYEKFAATLARSNITPVITDAEIAYTNQISTATELHEFLTLVDSATPIESAGGSTPHVDHYVSRAKIPGPHGEPIAALLLEVAASPPMGYLWTLLVRGPVPSGLFDEALQLLDKGRDVIVGTFEEVTTEAHHALWGKKETT